MKLSMSMLAWYMRDYHPICSVKSDMVSIGGIRFLTGDSMVLSPDYLYLGTADHFFADPKFQGVYVAVHCQSFLLFYDCEYDALLNMILSAIDFYEKWELMLGTAAAEHAPLQRFMELAEQVMDDFMVVCNLETELLASTQVKPEDIKGTTWEYFFENKKVSQMSLNSVILDREGKQIQKKRHLEPYITKSANPNICDKINMFLYQDKEAIAYLSVNQNACSHTEMEMQLIPVIAEYILMASEFTSGQSFSRSSVRFFVDLINGIEPEEDLLKHYQEKMAVPLFRIVYFINKRRNDVIYLRTFLKFLRSHNVICCEYKNGIAALFDDSNGAAPAAKELIALSGFSGLCCGVSVSSGDFLAIGRQIRQAVFVTEQVGCKEGVFCCEDYAFRYMLNVLLQDESVPFLLHPAIEKLYNYDRINQSELLFTLKLYLDNNKNLQKTLEALNIHRSTLKYRIQRIEDIIGLNLGNTEDEEYLRLSVWMKFYDESEFPVG